MKKVMYSRILLILFSMMIMMMFCSSASATVYTTEGFEDDTADANPSSGWYTYSENGEFSTANVSTGSAYGGSKSFYLNDSANDATSYANFSFDTVTYYDNFYLRFQIPDKDWHNSTNISFVDSSAQTLGYISITNTTVYFNNTGSNIINATISNESWYMIYIDFNLTSDKIGCYIYNESNSSELLASGWGDMEDGAGTYANVAHVRFYVDNNTKTSIYIDDLLLAYTYINPNQATNTLIITAVSAMFAVAILLTIVGFMYSGNVTPESLILLAVVIIIGVITLMIINGLL